jgi:Domain of unknown function (DUF6458)
MGIGASVFLIALGLILALAVDVSVSGVDLQLMGWILVLAGGIGLITSFVLGGGRRQRVTTVITPPPVASSPGQVVEERVVREGGYDEGTL